MSDQPTLYQLEYRPASRNGHFYYRGKVLHVEPAGTIEVYRINGKVNVEMDGSPDDGEYMIVRLDDE